LRPILDEESSGDELQKEAELRQRNFVNYLNRYCKKIQVCARSKRWWTEEIAENRRILGSIKKARKRGEATQREVKTQRGNLRRIIRQSNTIMW
jgi:CxxC motif-containing protein